MSQVDAQDLKLSGAFVRIVLGMDQLYRKQQQDSSEGSLDREGLVPIDLTGETPNTYNKWADVQADLEELRQQYATVKQEVRRNYMQQQIGSVQALARWSAGENIPFREKVRSFLYVDENPPLEKTRSNLHSRLDEQLTERGYKGSLHEKVRAWEQERLVPAHEIESVLGDLLAQAREKVAQRMFEEMADVEVLPQVVYGVPYSAYCDYVGGKMYINGDLGYTYEALKHLVTHESFPGHTTHMRIRELGIQSGVMPLDAGLVITNTASSSIFEGIADNGLDFIEWSETKDDEIFATFQEIRSISGLVATHQIHTEQRSAEEVKTFLRAFAFASENYIASRLRFFTHSLRTPFIYSYYRGYEAVRDTFQRVPVSERSRFYDFLYRNMLSADTVKQFV